jgi:uncharacterized protein (TIRG00374 family)
MKPQIKSFITQTLKIGLAAGLLYYLFSSGRINVESLKTLLTLPVLVFGLLTVGVVLYFASERWRLLLKQQGLPCTRGQAYRLTLIGQFFNFFVPGGVGGDVVKAIMIAKDHPEQRGKAVLTVLADRILGLFTMTLLALVSFSFEPELLTREHSFQIIFVGLVIITAGFFFAFWLLLSKQAGKLRDLVELLTQKIPRLHKLWTFAQTYRLTWKQLFGLALLSFGAQLTQILLFMVVAYARSPEIPPLSVFLFAVPVGFMVTAVPIAPAGIGIGQAAFFYLFSKALGADSDLGVLGITAFQSFQLCFGLIGAVFFVLLKRQNPKLNLDEG